MTNYTPRCPTCHKHDKVNPAPFTGHDDNWMCDRCEIRFLDPELEKLHSESGAISKVIDSEKQISDNEIVRRFVSTDDLPTYEDIIENWDHSDGRTFTVFSAKRDTVNGQIGYWVEFQYDGFICVQCGSEYNEPNNLDLCPDCRIRVDAHMDRISEYALQCSELFESASTYNDKEIGDLATLMEKHLALVKAILEEREAPF